MARSSHALFHAVGPETEKEQSPNLVEDRGTCKRFFEDDRSRLSATLIRSRLSAALMQKSEM